VARSPRTVIFDLDRTLISCDSFAGLLNSLLLRDWWRIGGVVAASPLLLPLWAAPTTRPVALWVLLWCATVGLSSKEFAFFVSAHARRLASEAGSKIYRDGLHALMAHQRSGDRVVIVTGSGCDLATAFCAAVGLDHVRVVGSTLPSRAGGWVVDEHCVGAHKVAMLTAAGVTPPWAVVYTDSASDLPLLRLAERRCVVNARPAALRAVQRSLGPGNFEMLRWQ
jgi:phosphatidylglycerophosphatase C